MDTEKEQHVLVDLIKKKQKSGYNIFYKQYAPVLYGTIVNIVQDRCLAEKLLKETVVNIWRKIDEFNDEKCTFFTWMLNVARELCFKTVESSLPSVPLKGHTSEMAADLVLLYGLSYEETARQMSLSTEQIKVMVRKGLKSRG